jgi:hypothetical protein
MGSSDSGKSTLLKQLRINYGQNFTMEERQDCSSTILATILNSVSRVIGLQEKKDDAYSIIFWKKYSIIQKYDIPDIKFDDMDDNIFSLLKQIGSDPIYNALIEQPGNVSDTSI